MTVKASTKKFGIGALKALFAGAMSVTVSRGPKAALVDLRESPPGSAGFAEAVLGPTGNLRAPTARIGNGNWMVGFGEESWGEALK